MCERTWPELVEVARSGRTINYQSLKDSVGFNGWQRAFSLPWPNRQLLPHQELATGVPGAGIPFVENFDSELAHVRSFPWRDCMAPAAEVFPESACLTS